MQGWIGIDTFGTVDRLGDESVHTEFICVVLPLWPLRSWYVHTTDEGKVVTEIRLHRTSVAAGYLRVATWMAALVCGLPGLVDPSRWGALLVVAAVLAPIASWLTFRVGRLSKTERARRELLKRVVGIGAPPELLPPRTVEAIRRSLQARWEQDHAQPWADAIVASIADEVLVALAEYHLRPNLADRARASLSADDWQLN